MESNTVLMGLYITLAGMGLVFLALGLVVLAIVIMRRAFRPKSEDYPQATSGEGTSLAETAGAERARVAAIAAAIVLATRQQSQHPDNAWRLAGHAETSPWQSAHRTRASTRRAD